MSQTTSTIRSFGFFLNGNWSTHGREAVVTSPYDHSVLAVVSEAGRDDVETAIESAVQAFAITRKMSSQQRANVLHKIVEGITARREEFARTICQEAGKPIKTARVEVERAINTFQIAAEESTRIYGEYIPLDTLESDSRTLGSGAAVSARAGLWHYAVQLSAEPSGAQGRAGDCRRLPHHPEARAADAHLVVYAGRDRAGVGLARGRDSPSCRCRTTMPRLLVADDRIKLLTFTGSAAVGWQLKSRAGKKRVTLELGGNAGVIVHSDADLHYAAQRCIAGGFSYGGQTCISVQRILVHQPVFEQVHRVAGARRSQAEVWRSHAGDDGCSSAHPRAGRGSRGRMD